jgi:hypothetical protein
MFLKRIRRVSKKSQNRGKESGGAIGGQRWGLRVMGHGTESAEEEI